MLFSKNFYENKINQGGSELNTIIKDLRLFFEKQIITHTNGEVFDKAFEYTNGHCFYCGKKLYRKQLNGEIVLSNETTFDHIIPKWTFSILVEGNTAICCKSCNNSKNGSNAIDYYNQMYSEKKITLYDTPDEFDEAIQMLDSLYKENFPLLYLLNHEMLEGEITSVSLENYLNCFKLTPYTIDFMLPIIYPHVNARHIINKKAVAEDESSPLTRETITEENSLLARDEDTIIYAGLHSSLRTNDKALRKEENVINEYRKYLKQVNPMFFDELLDMTNEELVAMLKAARNKDVLGRDSKRVLSILRTFFTRLSIIYKKPELNLDDGYRKFFDQEFN